MTDRDSDFADSRRERAVDALVEVAVRLAAAERIAPTAAEAGLQGIADATASSLAVTAISIAVHAPATDRLVFRAAGGPQGGAVVGLSIPAHDGIAGYVFSTGQALAVADAAADPRFERSTAERTGYIPRSLLAVPLIDGAGILGVLELLDRVDGAPFDLGDIELATRMAAAATAVARATTLDRDAVGLLRSVLAAVAGGNGGETPDRLDVEALIGRIAEDLSADEPLWLLADRIGQLRAADPDDLTLAVAWLDALLDRQRRRSPTGRRSEDRDSPG